MGESKNIGEIAERISEDIFRAFHWEIHGQKDENFECHNPDHQSKSGKEKKTHPGDVVFHYLDPYVNKRIHLHTDLKSYGKNTINSSNVRTALQSLAMTIECASTSESWRNKFLASETETEELRGLLFVANHDNDYQGFFDELLGKVNTAGLPIAKGQYIHVLGPKQINALYTVANDISRLMTNNTLNRNYKFFYPDVMLWKRMLVDDSRTPATIELLTAPYFILKHDEIRHPDNPAEVTHKKGSIVYYSRSGETVEEFIYLIDALLRYQLVTSEESVRIRVFNQSRSDAMKNNFLKAKQRYCSEWGFHKQRADEIESIKIDSVNAVIPNYCPEEIGWKD